MTRLVANCQGLFGMLPSAHVSELLGDDSRTVSPNFLLHGTKIGATTTRPVRRQDPLLQAIKTSTLTLDEAAVPLTAQVAGTRTN